MGQEIDKTHFEPQDFEQFRLCLNKNLQAFQSLLSQPGFGRGAPSFGAELELYLVDTHGTPKPINLEIHRQMKDKLLTLELNRFNLEYNFTPVQHQDAPFSQMKQQIIAALERLSAQARKNQARILPIGILPTLQASDLGTDAITDTPRFKMLAKALQDKRGTNFHVHIKGIESLDLYSQDVSLEGANTSFQFHYRVNPENFADAYNAAQLTSPLALALSANSPFFLGRKLWHETRISLFKQAIDYRMDDSLDKHLPTRVLFGFGWVRKDIYELFAENVYLFDPLLPICSGVDPFTELCSGHAPALHELRLHQGTIWSWNRPIYDPADDGHLRIELRFLPAGPTPCNMIASAALMSGLIQGMQSYMTNMLPGLPFRYAEQNFYRAARYGMNAYLFWPSMRSGTLLERPLVDILKELLPVAEEGLSQLGIADSEIKQQMAIIKGGLETQMNGAQWQINMFDKLIKSEDRETALTQLVVHYYKQYLSGEPVHEWSEKI